MNICPGNCGWSNTTCVPCPEGFQRGTEFDNYACIPCNKQPSDYDICYLVFWVLSVGMVNLFSLVTMDETRKSKSLLMLSLFFETCTASIVTLLSVHPYGSLQLSFCENGSILDWYTVFDTYKTHEEVVYCSTEYVYPRWSIVLLFLLYSVLCVFLYRIPIYFTFVKKFNGLPFYGSLYIFPFFAIIHFFLGAIIYETFPYILIFFSVLFNSLSLSMYDLLVFKNLNYIALLLIRYSLMSFSAVSLMISTDIGWLSIILISVLVPFAPTILYFLTKPLTDPKLHFDRY